MPDADWWQALWPDPGTVVATVGITDSMLVVDLCSGDGWFTLAIAKRALEDTTVRAIHAGRVVGLTVLTGEMVVPSQSLFTLVNTEEWFAVANFREFDLDRRL